jgi:hypothetical protein
VLFVVVMFILDEFLDSFADCAVLMFRITPYSSSSGYAILVEGDDQIDVPLFDMSFNNPFDYLLVPWLRRFALKTFVFENETFLVSDA